MTDLIDHEQISTTVPKAVFLKYNLEKVFDDPLMFPFHWID